MTYNTCFLINYIFFIRNAKLRAQLFTSLNADLRQDINGVFAFSRCITGTFPWRKCSVKALVTPFMYILTEIFLQWNKWLGPWTYIWILISTIIVSFVSGHEKIIFNFSSTFFIIVNCKTILVSVRKIDFAPSVTNSPREGVKQNI